MPATKGKSKASKKPASPSYAIVRTGGKQYKVAVGDSIDVESLLVDEGKTVELDQVLLVAEGKKINVGTPLVKGAKVLAEVAGNGRGKKATVFKYKPKVRYRRMRGHRQSYTRLVVKQIVC